MASRAVRIFSLKPDMVKKSRDNEINPFRIYSTAPAGTSVYRVRSVVSKKYSVLLLLSGLLFRHPIQQIEQLFQAGPDGIAFHPSFGWALNGAECLSGPGSVPAAGTSGKQLYQGLSGGERGSLPGDA